MDLIELVEKDVQKAVSSVDDIEKSLNQINSALAQMKKIALKAVNEDTQEDDRIQMQNELNQLSYELNQVGNLAEFEPSNLSNYSRVYGNQRTACFCNVAEGVDMSNVVLNGKDSRLSGDLTELIDKYIYVQNGLDYGTNVTITLDENGRVTLNGSINEYSTGNKIYANAYYMNYTVNEQNGDVNFSGYGLSFTIPYQEYVNFLLSGLGWTSKSVTIKINDYYDVVPSHSTLQTTGYVQYYGSGMYLSGSTLPTFKIEGADDLTSFHMSGYIYSSGTFMNVMYTLSDGTEVNDTVSGYNINQYLSAGKLKVLFDRSRYNSYRHINFTINLPNVYKLTRAGGVKTYKKTSRIVPICSFCNSGYCSGYMANRASIYSSKPEQIVIDLDISDSTKAANSIVSINKAIEKVQKKLDYISDLKL